MRASKLSEAERYIMNKFWLHGAMYSDELAGLVAEKGWKTTTLLTFLSRLAAKEMLTVEKKGKANRYIPAVTQSAYRREEGMMFLDERYGGSAKDFLAAIVDGKGLTKADITELRQWLSEQEDENA